ncbi:MAG TPA: MCP four helix bundle domain-containing protein, partial [Pararobbsia sp.]|nr:MCP four helix bundle domain-containing protein [Pararobbsia sp.]
MSISKRLIMTLAVALLALTFIAGIGMLNLTQAQQRFEYVQSHIMPSVTTLAEFRDSVNNSRRLAYRTLVGAYAGNEGAIEKGIPDQDATTDRFLSTYEKNDVSDAHDRQLIDKDRAALSAYRASRTAFLAKLHAKDFSAATAELLDGGAVNSAAVKLDDTITQHIAYNRKLSDDVRRDSNASYDHALWVTLVSAGAAFLI